MFTECFASLHTHWLVNVDAPRRTRAEVHETINDDRALPFSALTAHGVEGKQRFTKKTHSRLRYIPRRVSLIAIGRRVLGSYIRCLAYECSRT